MRDILNNFRVGDSLDAERLALDAMSWEFGVGGCSLDAGRLTLDAMSWEFGVGGCSLDVGR